MHWFTGRAGRAVLAFGVLLVLFVVAVDRYIWQASSDPPAHVDAVVVIGGAGMRLQAAQSLVAHGYADTLVASGPATAPRGCADVAQQEQRVHVAFICFTPDPFDTRGEARFVSALARRRGWRSLMVVTSTTQATRTRIRFRACWAERLVVIAVGVPEGQLARLTTYEIGALLKTEIVERGC